MALQIRQGTDAERQTITPASGEPIWTTDQKQLWVGDGSSVGGVLIASTGTGGGGYGSDQALYTTSSVKFQHIDIVNTASIGGEILFGTGTYQTKFGQDVDPGYDNYFHIISQHGGETFLIENYENVYVNTTGTVRLGIGDGQGKLATDNIYPTNSGVNNTLTVHSHVIPDADGTRDIGSPSRRFRHLYVTSSTIYLGENALTIDQNANLSINGQTTSDQLLNTTSTVTFQNLNIQENGVIYASQGAYGPPDNSFTNVRVGLYGNNPVYAIGVENSISWMQGQNGVKLYDASGVGLTVGSSAITVNGKINQSGSVQEDFIYTGITAAVDMAPMDMTQIGTVKYIVQVHELDGNVLHSQECFMLGDGTNTFLSQSNVLTTAGELGTFSMNSDGTTTYLRFTPNYSPGSITIRVSTHAILL